MKMLRFVAALAAVVACVASSVAYAADPVNGKLLYETPVAGLSCSNAVCHGSNPGANLNKVSTGANNATIIQNAINGNFGGMALYQGVFTLAQLQDIAAYIANPSAAVPGPVLSLSVSSLTFGATTVGTPSTPMLATLTNTGVAPLGISAIVVSGPNALSFSLTHNCGLSISPGASCTITTSFSPTAVGLASAFIAISHTAAPAATSTSIALTGTGISGSAPAVALSNSSVIFPLTTIGQSSAPQLVTVANVGTAPLTITSMLISGSNSSNFTHINTCGLGVLAAGASCNINITFTPNVVGIATASLSITSNAFASPSVIALQGNASPPVTPVNLTVTPSTLNFGVIEVGAQSTQTLMLINSSPSQPLSLGAITVSGLNADAFSVVGCSGVSFIGTCTLTVTFKPTVAVPAISAAINIPSNAMLGTSSVPLYGVAAPPFVPDYSKIVLSPSTLDFGALKLNTLSATKVLTLTNTGIDNFPFRTIGVNVGGDLSFQDQGTGSCISGLVLTSQMSCTIHVAATATTTGPHSSTLVVIPPIVNTPGHPVFAFPSATLKAIGVSDMNGLVQILQNDLLIDRVKVDNNGKTTTINLRNNGTQTIKVAQVVFTVTPDYKIKDECTGKTLKPGAKCSIEIRYTGTGAPPINAANTLSKSMTILTESGASVQIPIVLSASAATPSTAVTNSATPKASGGCTIGGDDQADLSQLAMLLAAVGVLVARRRKASRQQ